MSNEKKKMSTGKIIGLLILTIVGIAAVNYGATGLMESIPKNIENQKAVQVAEQML
jgi:hypothetical protein